VKLVLAGLLAVLAVVLALLWSVDLGGRRADGAGPGAANGGEPGSPLGGAARAAPEAALVGAADDDLAAAPAQPERTSVPSVVDAGAPADQGALDVSVHSWDPSISAPYLVVALPVSGPETALRGDVAECRSAMTPQEGIPRGRSDFGRVHAGHWRVEAFAPELFRHSSDPRWQRAREDGVPLVGLEPPARGLALAQRVVLVESGRRASALLAIQVEPARGARVTGRVAGADRLEPDRLLVRLQGVALELDEGGAFDSGWVPPGDLRLQLNIVGADEVIQNPPILEERMHLAIGDERRVRLTLPPTERIRFEVLDRATGRAIDGVAARVERVGTTLWRQLRADRDVWRFEAGEYLALLSCAGYESAVYPFTVVPLGGSQVPPMKLGKRAEDRRALVGPDGRGMTEGTVRFHNLGDQALSPRMAPSVSLDGEGTFDAAAVPPGLYPVSVSSRSHGSVRGRIDLRGAGQRVVLRAER